MQAQAGDVRDGVRETALKALARINHRLDHGPSGTSSTSGSTPGDLPENLEDYEAYPDRRARAFLTDLVQGVLRHRGSLDWMIERASGRAPGMITPVLLDLLRLGAYQLRFTRVPAYAAVDESVRLAHGIGGRKAAGFVNAVLRAIAPGPGPVGPGHEDALAPPARDVDPAGHLAIRHAHPRWLVERWMGRLGLDGAETLCQANNTIPPLTVRVNTLKGSREGLMDHLEAEGVAATPSRVSPAGLIVTDLRRPIASLASYRTGWFYPQDEGAQLVGLAVAPRPGQRILDACAAPGGKATHLAELMEGQGEVVALDVDPRRLGLISDNATRLGSGIVAGRAGDGTRPPAWLRDRPFDAILIDAPCSGLGVLRRHPDGKWQKPAGLITRMAVLQRRLLEALASPAILRPGGTLIYSTCSTEPDENEAVIEAFLARHSELVVEDLRRVLPAAAADFITPKGFLFTQGNSDGMDVFFVARLISHA